MVTRDHRPDQTHRLDCRNVVRASLFGGASAALLATGPRHDAAHDAAPATGNGSSSALANSVIFSLGDGLEYVTTVGDTLVLITADDERGGLTVEGVDDSNESGETEGDLAVSAEDGPFDVANSDYQFSVDWTTTGHTGVRVLLTVAGPGSELLAGDDENTDVFVALVTALGLGLELPVGLGAVAGTPAS